MSKAIQINMPIHKHRNITLKVTFEAEYPAVNIFYIHSMGLKIGYGDSMWSIMHACNSEMWSHQTNELST